MVCVTNSYIVANIRYNITAATAVHSKVVSFKWCQSCDLFKMLPLNRGLKEVLHMCYAVIMTYQRYHKQL